MKSAIVAMLLCCAACGGVPEAEAEEDFNIGVPVRDATYGCQAACDRMAYCRGTDRDSVMFCRGQCMGTVESGRGTEEQTACISGMACGYECVCGLPGVACQEPVQR